MIGKISIFFSFSKQVKLIRKDISLVIKPYSILINIKKLCLIKISGIVLFIISTYEKKIVV
jgi:hypothetical protein